MHIQRQFNETRARVLQNLIRSNPLATFIVQHEELMVNHFPLVLTDGGEYGVLQGHVPRSSELCAALSQGLSAIAVFQGPQGYISPSFYPSKREHGKVVPTWNYAVAHAHGVATIEQDPAWLLQHLNQLTDQQEREQTTPWEVADAPPEFTEKMIEQIVGIQLPIDKLVGKWKMSQNRSAADQLGVVEGLRTRGTNVDLAMAQMIMAERDAQ